MTLIEFITEALSVGIADSDTVTLAEKEGISVSEGDSET